MALTDHLPGSRCRAWARPARSRMDLQKGASSRFSLRPIGGKDITRSVIEDLINVLCSPWIHRVIAFDVRSAPTGECGGLSDECGESFFSGRVAAEIVVEYFEGFGVKIELAPRHRLAPLRLRLLLFALAGAPEAEANGGNDDEAYHRRNKRLPVAALALEPRFANLRDEDHCFVRPMSRRNLAHQLGQSVFSRHAFDGNLRKTSHAIAPPRQQRRPAMPASISNAFRHKAPSPLIVTSQ